MSDINFFAAILAGLLSFLSPCVLPLLPGFIAYLAGVNVDDTKHRWKLFLNTVFFVLGFSLIFASLGVLLNSALQHISFEIQEWLSRIGGLIIIVFGLHTVGLLKISFLQKELSFSSKKFSISYVTSFAFGAAFAVGWTPCVGALLGSVLALAIANPANSFYLLLAYSVGLGIPFLLLGLFTEQVIKFIKKSSAFFKYFNSIVGIFLILLGILVFTNNLNLIAFFIPNNFL